MPAVVRVKRRINEEPLGAFVLNGKKRRIDDSSTIPPARTFDLFANNKDEISTILKFAGTVQSQDDNVTTQIARLTKDEAIVLAKKQRQQPITNLTERARQEMRDQSNENRFKVVNCFRSIESQEITIVDIEKQSQPLPTTSSSSLSMTPQLGRQNFGGGARGGITENFPPNSNGYVYDLYLPENEQQANDVDFTDNYLSIHACDQLVYEDCYNDDEERAEESEDSNEENYFCNDYPDEEDEVEEDIHSINLQDMRRAIDNVNLCSDDEGILSTDENDYEEERRSVRNGFVFSIDALDDDFEDDVDFRDVNRYGTAYAKYKQKILRDMKKYDDENDDFEAGNYDDDENTDSD